MRNKLTIIGIHTLLAGMLLALIPMGIWFIVSFVTFDFSMNDILPEVSWGVFRFGMLLGTIFGVINMTNNNLNRSLDKLYNKLNTKEKRNA